MFSKKIFVTGGGLIEFNFHSVQASGKIRYHVSVLIPTSQSFHFEMKHKHGIWEIVEAPQPPKWIRELEDILSNVIREHTTLAALKKMKPLPVHQNVFVQY